MFAEIDRHALDAKPDVESSIDRLASYLSAPARTDREKARAVYRWIAARIRWGPTTEVNPGQAMDARPESVLRRRTAECLGFAMLFESLARKAGVEVASIHGYVRTDAATAPAYAANPPGFNHWWNAVKLDGEWKLLDCGWSVRGEDGTTASSAQGRVHLEPYYFLVPPEQLIYTHFPLDPKWQLTNPAMTLDEQKCLPYPRAAFFQLGLSIDSPREGTIHSNGRVVVRISAPEEAVMAAVLSDNGSQIARINARERKDGRYIFSFASVPLGRYKLSLFAKRRDDPGVYRGVLDYDVDAG